MDGQALNSLSIFELRDLARKVGVSNPTLLKKSDLISAIYNVQSGKVKPITTKSKQGRPPKELGGYDKLVGIFLPADITEIATKEERMFSEDDSSIRFCSPPSENEEYSKQITYKGFLEELENGSGLLRPRVIRTNEQKEFVYVSNMNMVNFGLKSGDEILCKANVIRDDRAMILIDIIEINGVSIKDYSKERVDFKDLPYDNNFREIITDKLKSPQLKYGDTIFVYSEKDDDFDTFVFNFLNESGKQFDGIIYMAPMMTLKSSETLKTTKAEMFATDFTTSFSNQQKTAFLAYNRARRLAESGKNILLIIDNILSLIGLDKNIYGDLLVSKTLVSTAKSFKDGSLTVMLNMPNIPHKLTSGIIYSTFPIIETVGLKLIDGKVNQKESYRK